MKTRLFLIVLFLVAWAVPFFAQTTSLAPDNRYVGYSAVKIEWPTVPPDCGKEEYYEPKYTSLARKMVNTTGYRVQSRDECVWMYTVTGWRYVLRPPGTKVAVDSQGRDLYDLGSPQGKECGNPRPVSIPILPPAPASPPAPYVAPPSPHQCPNCGDVEWSGVADLDHVLLTQDLHMSLTAHFMGEVRDIRWLAGDRTEMGVGAMLELNRDDFMGAGLYQLFVEGVDSDGHQIRCLVQINVKVPPPAAPPVIQKGHGHKKLIIGLVIGECIASAIISSQTGVVVPICGWHHKPQIGTKPPIKTTSPQ